MDYQQFLGLVRNKKLPNILLLNGIEIGDKTSAINDIIKYHFQDEEPQIFRFYCNNEFSKSDFISSVTENGLFSSKKLILVKSVEEAKQLEIDTFRSVFVPEHISIDKINMINDVKNFMKSLDEYYKIENEYLTLKKTKKEDYKKIINIFTKYNFMTVSRDIFIIFINDTNIEIPDQLLDLVTDNNIVQFYEMFDNKKFDWVKFEFNKYKLSINPDAVSFLLDTVENNKHELQNVIQNIAIYQESIKSNSVTRDSIDEFIFHSKQETPFTLFNAMINKDLEKSINILDKLFLENPMQILPGLLWSQRRLVKILDLYQNMKVLEVDIFQQLKITRKKAVDEMKIAIRNYSFKHSVYYYKKMVDLEYFMRILNNELKLVKLQEFIVGYVNGYIDGSFLQGNLLFLQY